MNTRKSLLLSCLLLIFLSACNPARQQAKAEYGDQAVSTLILVRHAEKQFGHDPELTEEGTLRAQRLADMLRTVELDAVYSSDTKRTRLTAAPAAQQAQLKARLYDPNALNYFARQLRNRHPGETVLVVGHSNTTPELANLLAGTDSIPRFSELDYGNLLIVSLPPIGKARILKLRY
ncbi:SixA phosphatase family protein [Neolewinella litorea]|uniref:Histidine phosphatase family protein n=1 Tax=Neolewinella litorea TaxID=2562452 RepID=A0A4S4NSZ1_9BACT|nr:phosphoglycerate mutase family protein [Neolewinella litorea]THH41591.1 histidine phosphatase family protein [Neolewinella litorea]